MTKNNHNYNKYKIILDILEQINYIKKNKKKSLFEEEKTIKTAFKILKNTLKKKENANQ